MTLPSRQIGATALRENIRWNPDRGGLLPVTAHTSREFRPGSGFGPQFFEGRETSFGEEAQKDCSASLPLAPDRRHGLQGAWDEVWAEVDGL